MSSSARALLERGVVAAERGRVAEGLAQIRDACAADPADPEAHAQLGRWLSRLNRGEEALAAIDRALELQPRAALTWDTIGVVLSRAGQHARAAACFERAASLEPGQAGLHFNLASSLRILGQFGAAERAYEACLACDPQYWRAHSAVSQLRRQTVERNHLERLRGLIDAGGLTVEAELHLRHALAKELEDLGRYAESFVELEAGQRRRRETSGYDFERDRVLFQAVMRLFHDPLPPPEPLPAADPGDAPIFVVGMPRSGTTLVERILASHSQVTSAGESQNFGVLLKRATGTPPPRVLDVATLGRSRDVDLAALGREYLRQTRPAARARPRFVDKMPLNFFYLGHIARALPGARMVVLRRHPLDTGLSNFQQLFATDFSYYDYARDLRDIGRYYAMFDRLVAHWRRVLPGRLHEVAYESLVADPRGETVQLLRYCGLDWEDGCLEFDRNPEPVATASALQVRQPLYASSVGRWRLYERELAPLRSELEAEGIAVT